MRIGKLGFLILALSASPLTPTASGQDEEEVLARAGAAEVAVRSFVDAVTRVAGINWPSGADDCVLAPWVCASRNRKQ